VSVPPGPGIDAPDVVIVGRSFTISILNETDPGSTRCRIVDATAGTTITMLSLRRNSESTIAAATLYEPGLYRIEVTMGSATPVERLLLAVRDI
jgi:hypothetical protein